MNITVNGKSTSLETELTVSELLASQQVESPDMVSVQVNGTILDRGAFDSTRVRGGDTVEFLYFMGGGA